jgi:HSP20 family protein
LSVSGEALHRETRQLSYRRVYELDPSIDADRISARIDQGILTVNLPKAEKLKPRRITLE